MRHMGYPFHAPGAEISKVDASASSVQLAAAHPNRKGVTVYNDSTATLFLALGTAASSDKFTVKLRPADYFECPYGYSGPLSGYWDSATGSAKVTEIY